MKLLWGELLYPVVIALVLFVALLLFGCKASLASPPGNSIFTQGVYVFSLGKDGDWHRRVAKVEAIPNSLATVCFEFPRHARVQCFWQEGNDTVVLDTRLVGEEKT